MASRKDAVVDVVLVVGTDVVEVELVVLVDVLGGTRVQPMSLNKASVRTDVGFAV
jgi:hypothetical protein